MKALKVPGHLKGKTWSQAGSLANLTYWPEMFQLIDYDPLWTNICGVDGSIQLEECACRINRWLIDSGFKLEYE